ncbi:hypothetical protein SNL152K_1135 [Streptomyces sp. NL15-2K]|nr:hypothetical protein SNL152K_1135 [Streptomyces sp. NL15-2K]
MKSPGTALPSSSPRAACRDALFAAAKPHVPELLTPYGEEVRLAAHRHRPGPLRPTRACFVLDRLSL